MMNWTQHTMKTRNTERPGSPSQGKGLRSLLLGTAVLTAILLASSVTDLRAETARDALQSYLNARLAGELETASGLWVREEMRRSRAMGIAFEQVEAFYDDYWLMSVDERQRFAENHTLKIDVSAEKEDVAHFGVDVVSKKDPSQVKDSWRYLVTKTESGWRVSLPLVYDTRSWTRRDGRFVTIRSKRLARVNTDATNEMDSYIDSLFVAFGTPKAAQLRLERVKYEVFIAEDEADVQQLVGSPKRMGYLPGNERILTTAVADLAALTNAVATLTLRKTPPAAPDFFNRGLGFAWGGRDDLSANVLLARTRNMVLRDELPVNLPFSSPEDKNAGDVQALWNHALFGMLGAQGFFELYAGMRHTPAAAADVLPEDIRRAIETATGKKGKELEKAVLAQLKRFVANIECGCDQWPADVPNLQSMLSWQDVESSWAMRAYESGDSFIIAIGAHRTGMPSWALDYVDSVAAANGADLRMEREPEPERPDGDPPYFVVTFGPRFDMDPEPYDSRLFGRLFASQEYLNQLLGLFFSHDMVRVYDYRIDRLIAEYDVANAPPGDPVFYDEELGRVCFRMRKSVFPKPIREYTPRAGRYTGE